MISSELAIVIKDLVGKKQPTPNCISEEGIIDTTDLNQNIQGDVTPNMEISKQPTLDIIDLNQNNPDDVILNTEISKQFTPNCTLGEGILDITDPNQNILDDVTPNTETSIDLQNNDLEKPNTELLDQKNSDKIHRPQKPPKRQRKQVALILCIDEFV